MKWIIPLDGRGEPNASTLLVQVQELIFKLTVGNTRHPPGNEVKLFVVRELKLWRNATPHRRARLPTLR